MSGNVRRQNGRGEVVVGANLGESVVGGADTGRRCRAERADYAYDGGLSSKKWKFLSQFNLENEEQWML